MYTRTISWVRPNTDVEWPWTGLTEDFNLLLESAPGLISKNNILFTDTEIINEMIWESKADWQALADNPITIELISAEEPLIVAGNIIKTVTESGE